MDFPRLLYSIYDVSKYLMRFWDHLSATVYKIMRISKIVNSENLKFLGKKKIVAWPRIRSNKR